VKSQSEKTGTGKRHPLTAYLFPHPIVLAALIFFGCAYRYSTVAEEVGGESALETLYTADCERTVYQPRGEPEERTVYQPHGEPEEPAVVEPRFALIPQSAHPGYPVAVAFGYNFETLEAGVQDLHAALLTAEGRRLTRAVFFPLSGQEGDEQPVKVAIFAIPSTAPFGDVIVRVESANGVIRDLPFSIESRQFHSETIYLDQRNTDLRTTPDPQRTAESQHIWALFNRTGTEVYTWDVFARPVTATRRTSLYGSRRIFQYTSGGSDMTVHNGIDYGVPTGTDVMASARGRVVLARPRIITGKSVVLEHLPGVYSIYYHLDSLAVNEGEIVEAGAILGQSGMTGLATGPHLHWEIRVSGEAADPDAFLSRPILDKNEILSHLSGNW